MSSQVLLVLGVLLVVAGFALFFRAYSQGSAGVDPERMVNAQGEMRMPPTTPLLKKRLLVAGAVDVVGVVLVLMSTMV